MSQQKVIILQGLPASGKSTYALQLVEKPGWKRVNKDELRAMIDNSKWSKENEKEILKIRDSLISRWLLDGYNVVVDDTNFAQSNIDKIKETVDLINALKDKNIEFEILDFNTPLYECIERDSKREKPVGKKVIIKMYNQYLRAKVESIPFKDQPELPTCVICDIDGTLAYSPERSVYDYKKVDKDLPNKKLIEVLKRLNLPIIVLSGRESSCKQETMDWLKNNGIDWTIFAMRTEGDNREDSIVKEELYNAIIKDKWNVLTVFDDRPRVIRMWKKLGLMVCDVSRQDPRVDF